MSGLDLAAVLVTLVAFASFVVLWSAIATLRRSADHLVEVAEAIRAESVPLLHDLRETAAEAGAEVERVDELLEAAEAISASVDAASRLGYLAFRAPLVRFVAFWKGVARALRRLRPRRRAVATGSASAAPRGTDRRAA